MEGLFSDYEAIRKSGLFDPEHYAKTYPDVAERNVDPLVHYLEEGAREGRDPQLEKAIEVVLKELDANPPKAMKRPPYPVRERK